MQIFLETSDVDEERMAQERVFKIQFSDLVFRVTPTVRRELHIIAVTRAVY